MDEAARESEARFAAYVESLASVLGHADREGPLKDYCIGLLMPGERKSVEPIARSCLRRASAAAHQSLLHFVGQSAWSDEAMLAKVRELVTPALEAQGGIEAWIVDDTGFQKKGSHSVGVARQYCGRLGKTDNCQIAVTLSIANHQASLPIAYRLYLPEDLGERRRAPRKGACSRGRGVPDQAADRARSDRGRDEGRRGAEASCWPTPATAATAASAPASRRWG